MTRTSRGATRTNSFRRGGGWCAGRDGPGASVARLGVGLGVVWVACLVIHGAERGMPLGVPLSGSAVMGLFHALPPGHVGIRSAVTLFTAR